MEDINVIFIGNTKMIDFPFVLDGNDWVIPVGWYLMDKQIDFNKDILYREDKSVSIVDKVDIAHYEDSNEMILSVIKTDKELQIGDSIKF